MLAGLLPTQSHLCAGLGSPLVARLRRQQRFGSACGERSKRSSVISNIATAPLPPTADVHRPARSQSVSCARIATHISCLLLAHRLAKRIDQLIEVCARCRSLSTQTFRKRPRLPCKISSVPSLSTAGRKTQLSPSATWSRMLL